MAGNGRFGAIPIPNSSRLLLSGALSAHNGAGRQPLPAYEKHKHNGSYTVRLVSNTGKVYSSKILVKQ